MAYSVLAQIDNDWTALKFDTGLISTPHMSAADVLAHSRFKDGSNVRVVNHADHSVIYYELNRDTHHVDQHGKVRPNPVRNVGPEDGPPAVIDLTPTWKAVLPILLMGLDHGTDEAKQIAKEELQRMAEAADRWNSSNR